MLLPLAVRLLVVTLLLMRLLVLRLAVLRWHCVYQCCYSSLPLYDSCHGPAPRPPLNRECRRPCRRGPVTHPPLRRRGRCLEVRHVHLAVRLRRNHPSHP